MSSDTDRFVDVSADCGSEILRALMVEQNRLVRVIQEMAQTGQIKVKGCLPRQVRLGGKTIIK